MPVLSGAYLRDITSRIFQAAGADDADARIVASSLVEANLTGHDSHGVIYIVDYLKRVLDGRLDPQAKPEIVRETATTMLVDGHRGFGQVVATWTMERLLRKASESNLAAAGIFHCGHIGRVGIYPAMGAEQGFICLAFANGGGAHPRVAPHGGIKPMLGTNPLAAIVPIKGDKPFVLDFATSVVASGKIRIAHNKGEELPDGWILDHDGQPSRNPQDYYDGGMLLPAAGYKGYALGLFADLLAGLLTESGTPILPNSKYEVGNGVFFIVIKVEAFSPLEEFSQRVRELFDTIRAAPPAVAGVEVLIPGEPEERTKAQRLAEGIQIPDTTWQKITTAAESVGVEL